MAGDREKLKIEKKEKLKECTLTEFYNGIAQKDWRDLSIIQLTDDKITATISHYFLILGKTKGKYKISKIIDLYVDSFFENMGIGTKLIEFAIQTFNVKNLFVL